MPADTKSTFWLPQQVSEGGQQVDWLFHFILWISVFFFALIVILMVVFVARYMRRPGRLPEASANHSTALELTWTAIPLVIVIVIFYFGFKGFIAMATPPADAYKIDVLGRKWNWEFTYPNGHSDPDLHVPVDRDVLLVLTSQDVIHSLYIPDFRLKKDAVPGRYTKAWFRATTPGDYGVFCAEYCGTGHSDMLANCTVHPPGEFEKWLEGADPLKKLTEEEYVAYAQDPGAFIKAHPDLKGLETPAMMGAKLYQKKGCKQCHSIDGSAGTGPSFKGIFGETHALQGGAQVVVDENYIRESVLEPMAKVRAGFQAVMPTYQGRLKDREIGALIAYIESLK